MKIDIHMHVNYQVTFPGNRSKYFSPKDVIRHLDENQFDLCCLLTWEEIQPQIWPPNQKLTVEDVFKTYEQYPSRILPMYSPDPMRDDATELLRSWHKKGIKGCAELKTTLNWSSPNVQALLATSNELELPVIFHMERSRNLILSNKSDNRISKFISKLMNTDRFFNLPRSFFNIFGKYSNNYRIWKKERSFMFPGYLLDFDSLEDSLIKFPNMKFIGHGPLFWEHYFQFDWDNQSTKQNTKNNGITWDLLRKYPNLYADLSGSGFIQLGKNIELAKQFISEFNEKILFGSDNEFSEYNDFLESMNISKEVLKKIYGQNAIKVLRL